MVESTSARRLQFLASLRSRRGNVRAAGGLCPLIVAAPLCLLLLVAWPAGAKEKKPVTRTISGAVLDPAENGISGAGVELTNLRTGKQTAIYSEQGGHYEFADLDPHDDYQLQATYKNQTSDVRKVTSLIRDMRVVINLHIPPPKSE